MLFGTCACTFFFVRILDESPHWLVSQQRYDEAQRVVDKMIRWNKVPDSKSHNIQRRLDSDPNDVKINGNDIPEANSVEEIKEGCCDIFKSRHFLKVLAICPFGW